MTLRGGWSTGNDPRAIAHDGHVHTAWVRGDNGDVGVDGFVLHANLQSSFHPYPDLHNAPCIVVRDDGHLVAFYSAHGDTVMRMRVSTTPCPVTAWQSEATLPITGNITYANAAVTANGDIHLLCRETRDWVLATSSNGGTTWSTQVLIDALGVGVYPRMVADGDRLDFAMSTHPDVAVAHGIQHFYWDGAYRRSNGVAMGSPPFDYTDMTTVTAPMRSWANGLAPGPVIGIAAWDSYPGYYDYQVATWDGSWTVTDICPGGHSDTWYVEAAVAGIAVTPPYVYVSRDMDGAHHIYEYALDGSGERYLAPGVNPAAIPGSAERVAWMTGRYADWKDWRTSISYGFDSSQGSQGPVGPQGPVGATGPQGPQGEPGVCDCCPSPPAVIGSLPFPLPE